MNQIEGGIPTVSIVRPNLLQPFHPPLSLSLIFSPLFIQLSVSRRRKTLLITIRSNSPCNLAQCPDNPDAKSRLVRRTRNSLLPG